MSFSSEVKSTFTIQFQIQCSKDSEYHRKKKKKKKTTAAATSAECGEGAEGKAATACLYSMRGGVERGQNYLLDVWRNGKNNNRYIALFMHAHYTALPKNTKESKSGSAR